MLLSRELALARTPLILLSTLLCTDGASLAALERRLAATDSAEAAIEEASDAREDATELTSLGILPASDVANDATGEMIDPPTEVTSPTTEVMSETIELTAEPRSWAATLAAMASNRVVKRCIVGQYRERPWVLVWEELRRGRCCLLTVEDGGWRMDVRRMEQLAFRRQMAADTRILYLQFVSCGVASVEKSGQWTRTKPRRGLIAKPKALQKIFRDEVTMGTPYL